MNDRVGARRPFAGMDIDGTWRDPAFLVRLLAVRRTVGGLVVLLKLGPQPIAMDVSEDQLVRFRNFSTEVFNAVGRWPVPPKNAGETAVWWASELKSAGFRPSVPPVKPAEPDEHVRARYQQLKVAASPRERLCA